MGYIRSVLKMYYDHYLRVYGQYTGDTVTSFIMISKFYMVNNTDILSYVR